MGSEQLNSEFRHVQEHLAHAIDRVDAMRDRVAGALSNHHTVLAKRTNDIVRVLTVFACPGAALNAHLGCLWDERAGLASRRSDVELLGDPRRYGVHGGRAAVVLSDPRLVLRSRPGSDPAAAA